MNNEPQDSAPQTKISENNSSTTTPSKPSLANRLRLWMWRLISLILLIALVAAVVLWKPWQPNIKASDRTVSVTGTATVKAEPDQYVFNPSYQFTNVDKATALGEMTAKSNEIIAKLKALGVADNQIKTDSSNYSDPYSTSNPTSTYDLTLTLTVGNKDLAQKVQDYLVSTTPTGSVTPQATFSTAKTKTLEDQARDKAEQEARSKAEQSAKNLGFKVASVKTVEDGAFDNSGCGGGLCMGSNIQSSLALDTKSLTLQPGQNELNYSVKVTFYIH
jgi:uncharacterized protein YggE